MSVLWKSGLAWTTKSVTILVERMFLYQFSVQKVSRTMEKSMQKSEFFDQQISHKLFLTPIYAPVYQTEYFVH